jgi:hypothetical protein
MTFGLFLLLTATLFLRPAELLPAVQGWPIYEVLMISCLVGSFEQIRQQLDTNSLRRNPTTLCVLGLLVAVVLSHATHGYFYGVRTSAESFSKTILYYFLLLAQVNTLPRMRWFVLTVALVACLMVFLCVIDYTEIVDFEFVTHVSDLDGDFEEGSDLEYVLRMRGTGIFEDPNDISLVIVAAGALCFYFLNDRGWGPMRAVWLLPIGMLALAMLFTRSRGGMLATGAAVLAAVYLEKGKWWALAVMALGVAFVPLVAGRQAEISLGAGTAAERMEMWREGFEALKSSSCVFGIGMGHYADLAGLVAHNSYLHAFVEIGLFGGTLYFGCYFFAFLAIYRMSRMEPSEELLERLPGDRSLREFVRLQPYVAAVLADWAMGTFTLSRCYIVPTYLVFGLAAAYVLLWQRHVNEDRLLVWIDGSHVLRLVGGSAALLVGMYVLVRLG